MKGIINITTAIPVENKEGFKLYEKTSRGYLCDECKRFFTGWSKDTSGDETFCYECAVKLGKRKPRETNNKKEIFFKEFKEKGLTDSMVEVLWKNQKKLLKNGDVTISNSFPEKERNRMKEIAKIQNEFMVLGYTRPEAMKLAHKKYKEANK